MEKSDCLKGPGQQEVNMERESLDGNQTGEDESSIKLDYIKQEVHMSSESEDWSAVLSSPSRSTSTCSNSVLVDPLEHRNSCMDEQNSNADVDGWINDGNGNTPLSTHNHAPEKGVDSIENSRQHSQEAPPANEHGMRLLLRCSHCSGSFSSEDSWAEHMKTHAGPSGTTVRSQLNRTRGTLSGEHGQGQNRGRQGPKTTYPWTEEQEEDLVAWWRLNECLYNGNCHGYLSRPRREKLFVAKAEEIGGGCTSVDIQIHLRSLRTKMNHILKDYPGGDGWQPRTPRGRWVWDRLNFIIPFIIQRNNTIKAKCFKGSSGEDSPSGSSDVSIGFMPVVPDTSNDVVSVSAVRERYAALQSKPRGRGRPRGRGARHHILPKKISQGQLLHIKSTTPNLVKSLVTDDQNTSVPQRHQRSVESPTSSISNTSSHQQSRTFTIPITNICHEQPTTSYSSARKHQQTSVGSAPKHQCTASLADIHRSLQLEAKLFKMFNHPQPILDIGTQPQPTTSSQIEPMNSSKTRALTSSQPQPSTISQPQPSTNSQPRASTSSQRRSLVNTQPQPVSSSDEEEVKAFLGHLKCTLLRIPADLRMEVQADILAMVYARHKEHRQSCPQP